MTQDPLPARPGAPAPLTARERLAMTRHELLRHMGQEHSEVRRAHSPPPHDKLPEGHGAELAADAAAPSGGSSRPEDDSLWQGLRESASAWWHAHPARLALELGQPVFEKYARAHPTKVLAVCAGTGAMLVLLRPWRLISITGLVVAAIKSGQMSHLASAVLRSSPEPGRRSRSAHRP